MLDTFTWKFDRVRAFFSTRTIGWLTISIVGWVKETCSERGKVMLEAIVGRYRVRMEDTGLVLTHPSGMCFDFTTDETLELRDFISVYRKALLMLEHETDPQMERIVIKDPVQES